MKYGANPRYLTLKGPQTSLCTNSKTSLAAVRYIRFYNLINSQNFIKIFIRVFSPSRSS